MPVSRRPSPILHLWLGVQLSLWLSAASAVTVQLSLPENDDIPETLPALLRQHVDLLKTPPESLTASDQQRLRHQAETQLNELLATEGYFSPDIRVEITGSGTDAEIRLAVEPRRRTLVREVTIEFAGNLAQSRDAQSGDDAVDAMLRDTLRNGWHLRNGMPFRQQDWSKAKDALLDALTEGRYLLGRILDSRADIDPDSATARLYLRVISGPPVRIGEARYSGIERVPRDIVERLYRLPAGEWHDRNRLLRAQARLQNSGYFSSVQIETDETAFDAARSDLDRQIADGREDVVSEPVKIPIAVRLTEAQRQRVGVAVGYSSDTGPLSELTYRNVNLFDSGFGLNGAVRLDASRSYAFTDVFFPVNPLGYRDSVGASYERSDIEGLKIDRKIVGARRLLQRSGFEWQYGLRYIDERSSGAGLPELHLRALAPSWDWTRRDVDDRMNPRSGHALNAQIAVAARGLLSDTSFTRMMGRAQLYLPIGKRDVLSLRAEAGNTIAANAALVPQDYLFRAGGTGGYGAVRGYGYQSLGVNQNGTTVGGSAMVAGSIEYTHWLDQRWGAAVFVDAGDAADLWQNLRPAAGIGMGARWRSPAGPLALDLAWGVRDSRLRLHFTIAIPF